MAVILANAQSPKAALAIDPATGAPYNVFSANDGTQNPAQPSANLPAPIAVMLIDPATGAPYQI